MASRSRLSSQSNGRLSGVSFQGTHGEHRQRIAVVRAGALGDVLLGVPALAALRRHFPEAGITLVGPLPAARVAATMSLVDELLSIDDSRLAPLFDEQRSGAQVIEPLRDLDVAVVWLSRAQTVADHLQTAGARRVVAAPPYGRGASAPHAADWLLATLAPLGVRVTSYWDSVPWLSPGEEGRAWAAEWHSHALAGASFAVLHPGSGSARKNWPAAGWVEVVRRVCAARGVRLVLTAGPADSQALADVLAAVEVAIPEPVVLREPDLFQLAGVLERAALYLGNDSGVTHLASGVGAPTVAVFGPTNPGVWRPRGPRVRVLGGNTAAGIGDAPLIAGESNWPEVVEVVEVAAALVQ